MNLELKDPIASDVTREHADWLELEALRADDRNSSYQDLVAAFRRAGTIDAIEDRSVPDRGSEISQQLADAAFSELSNRGEYCGDSYPFALTEQSLQLVDPAQESSPYTFMLLLKYFGVDAGPSGLRGSSLFEELSTVAAKNYLGGDAAGAMSFHFGFPRRLAPRGFRPALDQLCRAIQEGGGAKDSPAAATQKDAKLDLVAWKPFPDGRIGRVIAFGQCAAGDNYDSKASELSPRQFYQRWMQIPLRTEPLVFFFVPRCIDDDELDHVSALGSTVFFDRCRIAAFVGESPLEIEVDKRMKIWCEHVLKQNIRRR